MLGTGLKVGPAAFHGHPKHVLGLVFVRVLRIGPGIVTLSGKELGAVFLEGVRNVF